MAKTHEKTHGRTGRTSCTGQADCDRVAHPLLLLQLRELDFIPLQCATQCEIPCVGFETTLEAGNGTKRARSLGPMHYLWKEGIETQNELLVSLEELLNADDDPRCVDPGLQVTRATSVAELRLPLSELAAAVQCTVHVTRIPCCSTTGARWQRAAIELLRAAQKNMLPACY